VREDVKEAIDRVWPDDIVEMSFDADESYFYDVYPKLVSALHRIKSVHHIHEREADPGPVWFDGSDPDDDPPDHFETSRSYHLFFVSPVGKDFLFETEIETIGEPEFIGEESEEDEWEETLVEVRGTGRTGWVVAVSLVAPYAVIKFGEMTNYEDGDTTEPGIESYSEYDAGESIAPQENFRKTASPRAYKILLNLREKIAGILETSKIAVLPEEELRIPVPWLRPGKETMAAIEGRPLSVFDAFFFSENL
jgi:hypothetical protein